MVKKDEIYEIYIDSLAYGGEGVGKIDGMAVFVADTAPEDKINAQIVSVKKGYAKAVLTEITEPSSKRIKPACSLSKVCGGCQWHHVDYQEQLVQKRNIVKDNLKRIANIEAEVKDVISGENQLEYRCKVQYPVQQTKNSKRFLAGYYKKESHEIVNIKYCPVQPDIINKITQFIRDKAQEMGLTAYNERNGQGLIRHFVYRYSHTNKNLNLIIVINDKRVSYPVKTLAELVAREFKEVIGILANFNTMRSNIILGKENSLILGQDYIEEDFEGKKFKISAGSFFQVNPFAAVKMFDAVKDIIKERTESPSILDIYSGVGAFSIWLKDIALKITSIEESSIAIEDAKVNIELNKDIFGADIEILQGNADETILELAKDKNKFDVVILDPPRKGCSKEVIDNVQELAEKYIIYISCNPSTLARDASLLVEKGFTLEFVQPVDMFCHTYHVESIAVFKK